MPLIGMLHGDPDPIVESCFAEPSAAAISPGPTRRTGRSEYEYHVAVDGDGVSVACAVTATNVNETLAFERLFLAALRGGETDARRLDAGLPGDRWRPGGLGGGDLSRPLPARRAGVRRRAGRASWIPVTHNLIGFPDGISGNDLLDRMRAHARKFGADTWPGR